MFFLGKGGRIARERDRETKKERGRKTSNGPKFVSQHRRIGRKVGSVVSPIPLRSAAQAGMVWVGGGANCQCSDSAAGRRTLGLRERII